MRSKDLATTQVNDQTASSGIEEQRENKSGTKYQVFREITWFLGKRSHEQLPKCKVQAL